MFLKNNNIIFKIRRSKVTDYAALGICHVFGTTVFLLGLHVYLGDNKHKNIRPNMIYTRYLLNDPCISICTH